MANQAIVALKGELAQLSADLASLGGRDAGFHLSVPEMKVLKARLAALTVLIAKLEAADTKRP